MTAGSKPAVKTARPSRFFFLKQYLRNPFSTGAVTPSGHQLAELMVSTLDPQPGEVIVELGPGTGVFTRELLARGVSPADLILVEFNSEFVRFLKSEFPGVRIVQSAAQDLPRLLEGLGQGKVRKILSGIPLRSMKLGERVKITGAMAEALEPGGRLVQFSYFKVSPLPKEAAAEAGLLGACVGAAKNNVPPALVWQYIKAA
jgi:phosphatidylethanolamine/phosphatidyl-N-methylethanolamine N-methyltransferase